jgi:hypothetical protein
MDEPKWIETKKEYSVSECGDLIPTKVTLELEKEKRAGLERKEIIDISLRVVSLLAIFIPIVLFFKQQNAERDKQKALFQLEIYSKTTTLTHSITNTELGSSEFEQIKNNILYEIYPKHVLLNEKSITDTLAALKDVISYTSMISGFTRIGDSLQHYFLKDRGQGRQSFTKEDAKYAIAFHKRLSDKLGVWGYRFRLWRPESNSAISTAFIDSSKNMIQSYDGLLSSYLQSVEYSSRKTLEEIKVLVDEEAVSPIELIVEYEDEYFEKFQLIVSEYNRKLDSMMTRSSRVLYN